MCQYPPRRRTALETRVPRALPDYFRAVLDLPPHLGLGEARICIGISQQDLIDGDLEIYRILVEYAPDRTIGPVAFWVMFGTDDVALENGEVYCLNPKAIDVWRADKRPSTYIHLPKDLPEVFYEDIHPPTVESHAPTRPQNDNGR